MFGIILEVFGTFTDFWTLLFIAIEIILKRMGEIQYNSQVSVWLNFQPKRLQMSKKKNHKGII